jgi:hypothetical protein
VARCCRVACVEVRLRGLCVYIERGGYIVVSVGSVVSFA